MRWLGLWQKKEVRLSPELTSRLARALSEMSEFSDKDRLRRLVTSTLPSTLQLEARTSQSLLQRLGFSNALSDNARLLILEGQKVAYGSRNALHIFLELVARRGSF